MRGQTYIILAVVFAVIVAIFAVINVDAVEVNYLFGTGEAPLILVILISVLMGALITAAVGVVRVIRLQKENRQLKHEINGLKASDNTIIDDNSTNESKEQTPGIEENNISSTKE
ncbi:LapA family protein [Saliterribacillus persicus]|uniref:Putative integral membrane protein n=1 Tax=Saliterribacillus persicus TaxID=930114 RepID=A0A368XFN5_9BACI|nr:lipopolysaccharide assembly protein LapA domain-containing protein [Saliterribacillus persicus]RCW66439.1 putative integral membrane protein [Saliterribacillus persicus]